jgi:hypothetical protein
MRTIVATAHLLHIPASESGAQEDEHRTIIAMSAKKNLKTFTNMTMRNSASGVLNKN